MIGKLSSACVFGATVVLCLMQDPSHSRQEITVIEKPKPATGYMREMMYLDSDGDRRIDAKELAAGQYMASMLLMLSWEECDLNRDGLVGLPEFQVAADDAMQAMREFNREASQQAEEALAKAVTMKLLLDQLSREEQYAAEIAALRAEIADLNDDEAVVTYIVNYPTRYPRLVPIVRTWVRHYPVRPQLYRVVKPYRLRPYQPPVQARPVHPAKARPHGGRTPAGKAPRPPQKRPAKRRPRNP